MHDQASGRNNRRRQQRGGQSWRSDRRDVGRWNDEDRYWDSPRRRSPWNRRNDHWYEERRPPRTKWASQAPMDTRQRHSGHYRGNGEERSGDFHSSVVFGDHQRPERSLEEKCRRRRQMMERRIALIAIPVERLVEEPVEILSIEQPGNVVNQLEAIERLVVRDIEAEQRDRYEEFLERRRERLDSYVKIRTTLLDSRTDPPAPPTDAHVRKTGVLIRKIRNLTISNNEQRRILQDLERYNLKRYISEVSTAIFESKFGLTDLQFITDICVLMARRYADFVSDFAPRLLELCLNRKVDLSEIKVAWKLFGELTLNGFLSEKPEVIQNFRAGLQSILMADERGEWLGHALLFVRHYGEDFCDFIPWEIKCAGRNHSDFPPPSTNLVNERSVFAEIFTSYLEQVISTLKRAYRNYLNIVSVNRKTLETRGMLKPKRQQFTEDSRKLLKKVLDQTNKLAEFIGVEERQDIDLGDFGDEREAAISFALGGTEIPDVVRKCPYESEELRRFYEDLPDSLKLTEAEQDIFCADDDDDDEDGDCQNVCLSGNTFFQSLEDINTIEQSDAFVNEFMSNHNSRQNRQRLGRYIFDVNRYRSDLMTYHARIVATLASIYPYLGTRLTERLKGGIRFQVKLRIDEKTDMRVRMCRFLGELVKFRICPTEEVLSCIKHLLTDFTCYRAEMICALLESCGLFLYRTPESHNRLRVLLDILKRKRDKMRDQGHLALIDSAIYYCERTEDQIEADDHHNAMSAYVESLPVEHRFVMYLFRFEITDDVDEVSEAIMDVLERDETLLPLLVQCFSHIDHLSMIHLSLLCQILSRLPFEYRHRIIESIIDRVGSALQNSSDFNKYQRLLALATYIAQMLKHKVINTSSFLDVYYFVLSPNQQNHIDPSDALLRLRMACTMLEVGGLVFRELNTSESHRHLDLAILFLQKIFWFVRSLPYWTTDNGDGRCLVVSRLIQSELVFPAEVVAHFYDTVATLWYGFVFACDLDQAVRAFDGQLMDEMGDVHISCEENTKKHDTNDRINSPLDTEKKEDDEDEDEEDFDVVFQTLLAEEFKLRTNEVQTKRASFALSSVPKADIIQQYSEESSEHLEANVKFTLLGRYKNRPNVTTIDVPRELNVVRRIEQNMRTKNLENEELKKRTLHLSMMQEMEETEESDIPVIERRDVVLDKRDNGHSGGRRNTRTNRKQRK